MKELSPEQQRAREHMVNPFDLPDISSQPSNAEDLIKVSDIEFIRLVSTLDVLTTIVGTLNQTVTIIAAINNFKSKNPDVFRREIT